MDCSPGLPSALAPAPASEVSEHTSTHAGSGSRVATSSAPAASGGIAALAPDLAKPVLGDKHRGAGKRDGGDSATGAQGKPHQAGATAAQAQASGGKSEAHASTPAWDIVKVLPSQLPLRMDVCAHQHLVIAGRSLQLVKMNRAARTSLELEGGPFKLFNVHATLSPTSPNSLQFGKVTVQVALHPWDEESPETMARRAACDAFVDVVAFFHYYFPKAVVARGEASLRPSASVELGLGQGQEQAVLDVSQAIDVTLPPHGSIRCPPPAALVQELASTIAAVMPLVLAAIPASSPAAGAGGGTLAGFAGHAAVAGSEDPAAVPEAMSEDHDPESNPAAVSRQFDDPHFATLAGLLKRLTGYTLSASSKAEAVMPGLVQFAAAAASVPDAPRGFRASLKDAVECLADGMAALCRPMGQAISAVAPLLVVLRASTEERAVAGVLSCDFFLRAVACCQELCRCSPEAAGRLIAGGGVATVCSGLRAHRQLEGGAAALAAVTLLEVFKGVQPACMREAEVTLRWYVDDKRPSFCKVAATAKKLAKRLL